MRLLKGKKIADKILAGIKKNVQKSRIRPGLAVILVGKNAASEIYVKLKNKAAQKVGINFKLIRYDKGVGKDKVIADIKKLNNNKNISGIIVQLPLPKSLNPREIIDAIDPKKDADGFHPHNVKLFLQGKTTVPPVFPRAIFRLLESSGIGLTNKSAIIVANSPEFGKTMKKTLEYKKINADYILAGNIKKHSDKLKKTDIIITATGKPNSIKGELLKKGMVVIDGGLTRIGKEILGDVDRQSVKKIVACLSPVPGGVGPLTIAYLLDNVRNLSVKAKKTAIKAG